MVLDMEAGSGPDRAREVAEGALGRHGVTVERVRRAHVHLRPGRDRRATYRVRLHHAGHVRQLVLVAHAWADAVDWAAYAERLAAQFPCADGNPLRHQPYLHLDHAGQCAWWFAPLDPGLVTLAAASDGRQVRRILAPRYSTKTPPARVEVETLRYRPEAKAVLRYRITDRRRGTWTVFGKLYADGRGRVLHATMRELWELSQRTDGRLRVVEPLAYDDELALHLEHHAPGEPVTGERTHPRFRAAAVAAAEALAVLHDSLIRTDRELRLAAEVARLERVVPSMAMSHPPAGAQLGELLTRIGPQLRSAPPEEVVVTHGDLKYDQLLDDGGSFTLVDFEELGRGEISWDLGKWCAHAVPSMPTSWQESEAAEVAREAFLTRYRELRPSAATPRFPIYEAVHLANRAMVLMWGQREGWGRAAESLLTLAMERLQATSTR